MDASGRNFLLVTGTYWGFTLTDGALRMLVVLTFHQRGYSPLDIAFLFLFYEFFGVVTNLLGGWLGARLGLNTTMFLGTGLQVAALLLLGGPAGRLTLPFVMAVQAVSGIAKDLNKMSAKASVKLFAGNRDAGLFRWVAVLTGSKNALKGAGFFLGGLLLAALGFQRAVWVLAAMLTLVGGTALCLLPRGLGVVRAKPGFKDLFSKTPEINRLSAARFFLFGARDVWFVVAVPLYLHTLGKGNAWIGAFMALWVIGYGAVQVAAPRLLGHAGPGAARTLALVAALVPAVMVGALTLWPPLPVLIIGLAAFGLVFALNSSVHSYLILAYSDHDKVALNVGFYYMSNAAGRLVGTVLSGAVYLSGGLRWCLVCSALMLLGAAWPVLRLRAPDGATQPAGG